MYFSRILLLALCTTLATSSQYAFVKTLPSFSAPNDRTFTNVVVDHNTTDVYVAAKDILYHLSGDLKLKQAVTTGPLMDHPDCLHPSFPCSKTRWNATNDNNILEIVRDLGPSPVLLMCGSVYRRICQIRPLSNLTEVHWVHPFNQSEGYSSAVFLTRTYFGPGPGGKRTMFTASTEDPRNRARTAPFLTAKVLVKEPPSAEKSEADSDRYSFQYAFQNNTDRSVIEFQGTSKRSVFDGGLEHDGFIYFLVYLESGGKVSSVISRVCARDGTFRSYAELTITCNFTDSHLTLALAFHLDFFPLLREPAFYVTFKQTTGVTGTALCIFPMNMVVNAFSGPRKCLAAVGHTCETEKLILLKDDIIDFCGPDVIPYSVRFPLKTVYLLFLRATVTAITTVMQNDVMVAILGSNNGFLIKISTKNGEVINLNDMLDARTSGAYRSPIAFDSGHKHIYPLVRNKIIKFPLESCGAHVSCHLCQTKGKLDPLRCGWCNGTCRTWEECLHMAQPQSEFCPPRILDVSPLKGPLQGGIKIRIEGISLGTDADDHLHVLTVAGVHCNVFTWTNTEIICTLGAATEETSGPVEVHVITPGKIEELGYGVQGWDKTVYNFTYFLGPRLYGLRPNRGPKSGGTTVTLIGENLEFDKIKPRFIIVRGRYCRTVTQLDDRENYTYNDREYYCLSVTKLAPDKINKTIASCVTDNQTTVNYPDKTGIYVDKLLYVMVENPPPTFNLTGFHQNFQLIPDPEIIELKPGVTTLSGLMNLTVTGRYLDSTESPQIVVHVYVSEITTFKFTEDCWSQPGMLGTTLTCRTPSLSGQPWLPLPTRTHPLLTHVSFVMDGVLWVRDLPRSHEFVSRLLYYPDPEFRPFDEREKIMEDQRTLEVKGNYLDIIHEVNNFQIKIGKDDSCKITSISTESLVCDLPSSLKDSSLSNNNLSVEVSMGSIVHHLGYIEITRVEQDTSTLVISMIVVVVSLVVPIIAVVWCYRKFWRKKPLGQINNLSEFSTRPQHDYRRVATACEGTTPASEQGNRLSTAPRPVCRQFSKQSDTSPVADQPAAFRESISQLEMKGRIVHKEELVTGEFLGSGQFGQVFKGILARSNESTLVAIKTLHKDMWGHPEQIKAFMQEALNMADFEHGRVLCLVGVCFERQVPQIVLPYLENGDLLKYLRGDRRIQVYELLMFAVDIAEGMLYLEENKFVHRDLAARNCILDSENRVKVADFGMTRDIYQKGYYLEGAKEERLLPVKWTPPEALDYQKFSSKSDVWSYGVVLWELMTRGSTPYHGMPNSEVANYIREGNKLSKPQYCPDPLYEGMRACWNLNEEKRPSFYELHAFISDFYQRTLLIMREHDAEAHAQNSVYANVNIPAEHGVCEDSRQLYLSMEGQTLNTAVAENFS